MSDWEASVRCMNLVRKGYRSGCEAGELPSDVADTGFASPEAAFDGLSTWSIGNAEAEDAESL